MTRHVFTFKPRFIPLVADGRKAQTFRTRKHPPSPGDPLSLRYWTGRPYGSKQAIIREAECLRVVPCILTLGAITLADGELDLRSAAQFAEADGFTDLAEFFAFFEHEHGLGRRVPSITGQVTYWKP